MGEAKSILAGGRLRILRSIHQKTQEAMASDLSANYGPQDVKTIRIWEKALPVSQVEKIAMIFKIDPLLLVDPDIDDEHFTAIVFQQKINPGKKPTSEIGIEIDAAKDRGMKFFNEKEYNQAIIEFSKVLELDPQNIVAHFFKGRSYQGKGGKHHHDAIKIFSQIIRSVEKDNLNFALSYFHRGRSFKEIGSYEKAINDFTETINQGWGTYIVYIDRGNCLLSLNENEKALADFKLSIDLAPQETLPYENRAEFLLKSNNFDAALNDFSKIIEIDCNNFMALYRRGLCYLKKNNYKLAIEDFQRATDANPNHPYALNDLALILATCPDVSYRDGKRAIEYAKSAVSMIGKPEYIATLAAAYAEAKLFNKAIKTQTQVIKIYQLNKDKDRLEENSKILNRYIKYKKQGVDIV